jgi:glycosyltransferase involved in cell wall biosynthesis
MKVLYQVPMPPPKRPLSEAISQEIEMLRKHFSGEVLYFGPRHRLKRYVPRLLFGFEHLNRIRRLERRTQIHQIYNPDLFAFPILRLMKRPVVYVLNGGAGKIRPNVRFFDSLAAVAVFGERDFTRLRRWGLNNVWKVRPGTNTPLFSFHSLPLKSEVHVMMASAPWTLAQFKSKGIEALLSAAQMNPNLHLVFLWRGILGEEMAARIQSKGLLDQVTLIDEHVDVNRILAGVHATIVLASDPDIVKAYPHSLLDSLAAGKPVLVSRAIPMADYVKRTGCGEIVEAITAEAILTALEQLVARYTDAQQIAQEAGQRDFTKKAMVDSFGALYRSVLG